MPRFIGSKRPLKTSFFLAWLNLKPSQKLLVLGSILLTHMETEGVLAKLGFFHSFTGDANT